MKILESPIALVTGPVKGEYANNVDGRRLLIRSSYFRALIDVGIIPIALGPWGEITDSIIESYISLCDFLLITGGTDVDPQKHGQLPSPETDPPDEQRENLERELMAKALELGKPIVGICMGMQKLISFLAVYHQIPVEYRRNLIYQHILESSAINHQPISQYTEMCKRENMHPIHIVKDSLLYELYGEETLSTSLHHQAANITASEQIPGGRVVAFASDGTAEAYEYMFENGFAIAVQGHWETLPSLYRPLFRLVGQIALERRCVKSN